MSYNPITKMKELFLERGWCQSRFENDVGAICLEGARFVASHSEQEYTAAYNTIHCQVPQVPGKNPIVYWNDHPQRTFSEVMAVLDEAEILYKERYINNTEMDSERRSLYLSGRDSDSA